MQGRGTTLDSDVFSYIQSTKEYDRLLSLFSQCGDHLGRMRDGAGRSPLMVAVMAGNFGAVQALITTGVNVEDAGRLTECLCVCVCVFFLLFFSLSFCCCC